MKPIPEGYPQVMAYLCVDGADAAIKFYQDVFGAKERMRMADPSGKVGHAELEFGEGIVMLADEYPDMGIHSPKKFGGTPVTLHVYVENSDDVFQRAIKAGSTAVSEVQDQFYGDRSGQFVDPFGHRWNVATHVEDVPADEMERRAREAMGG